MLRVNICIATMTAIPFRGDSLIFAQVQSDFFQKKARGASAESCAELK
jgi:hypothetical protein